MPRIIVEGDADPRIIVAVAPDAAAASKLAALDDGWSALSNNIAAAEVGQWWDGRAVVDTPARTVAAEIADRVANLHVLALAALAEYATPWLDSQRGATITRGLFAYIYHQTAVLDYVVRNNLRDSSNRSIVLTPAHIEGVLAGWRVFLGGTDNAARYSIRQLLDDWNGNPGTWATRSLYAGNTMRTQIVSRSGELAKPNSGPGVSLVQTVPAAFTLDTPTLRVA